MTPSRCTLRGSLLCVFLPATSSLCRRVSSGCVTFFCSLWEFLYKQVTALALPFPLWRWPVGKYKGLLFVTLRPFSQHAYACYCICRQFTPVHLQHHAYVRNLSQSRGNKCRGEAFSLLVCLLLLVSLRNTCWHCYTQDCHRVGGGFLLFLWVYYWLCACTMDL